MLGHNEATACNSVGCASTSDSDHGDLQGNHRGQKLFQAVFGTLRDVVGMQDSSGQDITEQIDRFVPLIWLNAIDREHDAFIFVYLLFPGCIMGDFRACAQQRGVGFKEKQDFSARDRLLEWG
jgi:hypothetical protein